MWMIPDPCDRDEGATDVALDCESIGRLVRQWTLEAVAFHFAALHADTARTLRGELTVTEAESD